MAALIGPQKGRLVVARADQLSQLQMVLGTMYGSQEPYVAAIIGPPGPLVSGTSLRVTGQWLGLARFRGARFRGQC